MEEATKVETAPKHRVQLRITSERLSEIFGLESSTVIRSIRYDEELDSWDLFLVSPSPMTFLHSPVGGTAVCEGEVAHRKVIDTWTQPVQFEEDQEAYWT